MRRQWFILANLLGIIHHQRPGFLSYPSSHLVPYLREKQFPRNEFPELYEYRDLQGRLERKIRRSMKRLPQINPETPRAFSWGDIKNLPNWRAEVAITSPPYMNALDYGRDNRLRLWFLGTSDPSRLDRMGPRGPVPFVELMVSLAESLRRCLPTNGTAVLSLAKWLETNKLSKLTSSFRQRFKSNLLGGDRSRR